MFGRSTWLPAAAALALGLLATMPALGQADPAADVAALKAQIAALTIRVEALEKAAKEPVKAPFSVADKSGKVIFKVDDDNDNDRTGKVEVFGILSIGRNGFTSPMQQRGDANDDEDEHITLSFEKNAPKLEMKSGDNTVSLGTDDEGPHLTLHAEGGGDVKAGPDEGEMKVTVSHGKANEASLISKTDGALVSADESLSGKSAKMGTLDDGFGFSGENHDTPRVTLSSSDGSEYSLQFFKAGGSPILQAGIVDGEPAVKVSSGSKDLAVLAAKGGTQGELTLSDNTGEVAKMGALGSSGTLQLSKGGQPTITLGPTEEKALPAVRAYDKGKMVVAAGGDTEGSGIVVVYGGATPAALIEGFTGGKGTFTAYSSDQPVVSINSVDKPGEGLVVVRNSAGIAVATLGYGSEGGGNVTTTDASGNGVFSAGFIGGDGPGSACVEYKGTKCLGVGLTGMEGFH
jgi:hypothetical protein